jgi:methylated-DNA-[protein]-cysteine S-methyltransferase
VALTISTPLGPFTLLVDGAGAVMASGWTTDTGALAALIKPSLRDEISENAEGRAGGKAADAVAAYFDGDVLAIDAVDVRQTSGPFIEGTWELMRATPPGSTRTYTHLAAASGRPDAIRAAGSACARNGCALFVPCHRILRSDGTLGGFRWGLDVKRALLAHEANR